MTAAPPVTLAGSDIGTASLGAIALISSYAAWAAATPVISAWSYAGATSTMSAPTRLSSPNDRRMLSSSRLVSPPASGVPVPGAYAGSSTSMSSETYVGRSPTRALICSTAPRQPMSSMSCAPMTWKPSTWSSVRSWRE